MLWVSACCVYYVTIYVTQKIITLSAFPCKQVCVCGLPPKINQADTVVRSETVSQL